jgi:hypothetical protein
MDRPVYRRQVMGKVPLLAILGLTAAVAAIAAARPAASGFLARRLAVGGRELRYQVYAPAAYTPRERWPLVLFLHGSGERGSDNAAQLREGLAPAIRAHPHWLPLLAVFPQAPAGARWLDATRARRHPALHRVPVRRPRRLGPDLQLARSVAVPPAKAARRRETSLLVGH